MQKTTLYLPDELHRKLQVEARHRSSSQAEILREALASYLERQQPRTLRSLAAGQDAELAARDAKDWLAKEWAADR